MIERETIVPRPDPRGFDLYGVGERMMVSLAQRERKDRGRYLDTSGTIARPSGNKARHLKGE